LTDLVDQEGDGQLSTGRIIAKNFLSLTVAAIVSYVLGFFAVAYLARVLGAEGFGKISFALAISGYFLLLNNLGLDFFGTREIAKEKDKTVYYTNHIISIKFVASIISFLLMIILLLLIPKPTETKNLILLYGLSLFPMVLIIEWVFIGLEKMEIVALSRIARQFFYVLFVFLIVRFPQQILFVPLVYTGSILLSSSVLLFPFIRNYGFPKPQLSLIAWRDILEQSLPLGVSLIIITFYYSIGTVILGFMKDDKTVGWYSAAYRIVLLLIGFAGLLEGSLFPVMSRYYKESLDKLNRLVSISVKTTIFFSVPLAIGGTVVAKDLINLIYGPLYINSVLPFQILIWSVFIVYFQSTYAFCLIACDKQRNYLYAVSAGAVANLFFSFLLIPMYSFVGAAISAVICETVVSALMLFYSTKVVRFNQGKYLVKAIIAAGFMGLIIYFLQVHLVLKILIGILIYLSSMLILRTIKKEELELLKTIVWYRKEQ
jgi:O-antigen/teichoic acid export membrane protein